MCLPSYLSLILDHMNKTIRLHGIFTNITIDAVITPEQAKNLGVTLDTTLEMSPHVTTMAKTVSIHFRNISQIQ